MTTSELTKIIIDYFDIDTLKKNHRRDSKETHSFHVAVVVIYDYGFSQVEVAKILDTSRDLIQYYYSKRRTTRVISDIRKINEITKERLKSWDCFF